MSPHPDPDRLDALTASYRDPATVVLPMGGSGLGPWGPLISTIRARLAQWDFHVIVRIANAGRGPARGVLGDIVRGAERIAGDDRADPFRALVAAAVDDGRQLLPDDIDHDPARVAAFRDPLTEVLCAAYGTLVVHDRLDDLDDAVALRAAGLGLLDAALRPDLLVATAVAAAPEIGPLLAEVPVPVEPRPSALIEGVHRAWGWGIVHGVGGRPLDGGRPGVDPFAAWFGWDRSVAASSNQLLAAAGLGADHPLRMACDVLTA